MGVRRRVERCLRSTARTLGVLCGVGRSILFHIGEGIFVFVAAQRAWGACDPRKSWERCGRRRSARQYSRSVRGTRRFIGVSPDMRRASLVDSAYDLVRVWILLLT
jgi:hypothetical protein